MIYALYKKNNLYKRDLILIKENRFKKLPMVKLHENKSFLTCQELFNFNFGSKT